MEFYSFPQVILTISNLKVEAFITAVSTELTNQLKGELG